jgi:hypothetical protein
VSTPHLLELALLAAFAIALALRPLLVDLLALALTLAGWRPSASPVVATTQRLAPEPRTVAPPPLATLTVVQLREVARAQLGPSHRLGGRRIAQATRAALLEALA